VCFFIVGMLILYSAKIWALTVEKLISPPTASLIFSVRFNNSFVRRRRCRQLCRAGTAW
jgi:hypothetical protein